MSDSTVSPEAQAALDKVDAVIRDLRLTYDARFLAIALLSHGTGLYQALVTAGIRTPEQATELFGIMLDLALTPTKEKPRVVHVNSDHPRRLN